MEPKGIEAVVYRQKDGQWNFDRLVAVLKPDGGSAVEATDRSDVTSEKTDALPIRIQRIAIGAGSRLEFRDETPEPPYRASVQLERFKLGELDSSRPETPSSFELTARVDEKAQLSFDGDVAPFASPFRLGLKGNIEGLPLPPLSSYTGQLLGYNLDSGELNVETRLDIKEGQVDGANTLTIHQLDVSPLSAEKMAELNTELNMPLDTALGMLRDKNNTIKLELPVSGAMDDIKVDPSDAINQAVGRALKKGATTYLSAALFPFGTMLTIAQIAGEQAAKVRLDPVFFTPAAVDLGDKDHEYLSKIATILQERPEIHIKVCGRAVEADRAALYAQAEAKLATEAKGKPKLKPEPVSDVRLNELAAQRASVIERYLTESHGIKDDRLISCQPLVEPGEEAAPRTELLL